METRHGFNPLSPSLSRMLVVDPGRTTYRMTSVAGVRGCRGFPQGDSLVVAQESAHHPPTAYLPLAILNTAAADRQDGLEYRPDRAQKCGF